MKKITTLLACLLVLIASAGFAQKISVTSGKLDFLKGQQKINIVYDYEKMGVGKYTDEQEYVNDKVNDYNEKEAGKGDEWKKNWIADRKNRFEPQFEELLNKHLEKSGLQVGNYPEAAYTIVLKTTFTEPGFNVGVWRQPAFVNLEAVFVKTGSTDALAVLDIKKSPGRDAMGFDFDSGYRIQEAYAKAGKEMGQYLIKKAF